MEQYRIVLGHGHSILIRSIKRLLSKMPGVEVVSDTKKPEQIPEILGRTAADMIIVDVTSNRLAKPEFIDALKMSYPDVKIVIMHDDKKKLKSAMTLDVEGYLLNQDLDIEILSAIEIIRNGGQYVSTMIEED